MAFPSFNAQAITANKPSVGVGAITSLQTDQWGNLAVTLYAGTGNIAAQTPANADGFAGPLSLPTFAYPMALGSGGIAYEARSPDTFKTVATSATGSTAVWTPASGKKFRLLRYKIVVSSNAIQAVAQIVTIDLLDSATSFGQTHTVFVPAAAGPVGPPLYESDWIDLSPLGFRSAVANNVLNINLSVALTGGMCRVLACGVEE